MEIVIREGSMREALEVLHKLPEFDRLLEESYYVEKLRDKKHLVIIALDHQAPIGCKVGYEKTDDGSFYSWLGGVIPTYRKNGIAKMLSDKQEQWAKNEGYSNIKFKTLNRHKAMLHFSLNNGFYIYNVKPKDELENYRIELTKQIS